MDNPGKYSNEIKDQLDRMLTHSMFKSARRSCSFLRYVTEKTLSGESYKIKEFSIAVDAFGLEPTFDQQIDPRIRVEAKRLRDRLKLYYEGPGKDDSIIIALEKGSYVPGFRLREVSESEDTFRKKATPDATVVLVDGGFFLNISFENDAVSQELSARVYHFQSLFLSSLVEKKGVVGEDTSLSDLIKLRNNSLPINLELHFHSIDGQLVMDSRLSLSSPGVLLKCSQTSPDMSSKESIQSEAAIEAEKILEYCRSMKS